MDFVGGALPNVMFLIGMMAIGIGLGLEFKIVEVKGDLGRGGRVGAFGVGLLLIGVSIYLYLTPKPPATAVTSASPVVASPAPPTAQALAALATEVPTAQAMAALATEAPSASATPEPTAAPTTAPTATPEPSPTPIPPTATPEPSPTPIPPTATAAATSVPLVEVPDIRNLSTKDADSLLRGLGLVRGEEKKRCSDLGVAQMEVRKGRIACQLPEPGAQVAPGTKIDFAFTSKD